MDGLELACELILISSDSKDSDLDGSDSEISFPPLTNLWLLVKGNIVVAASEIVSLVSPKFNEDYLQLCYWTFLTRGSAFGNLGYPSRNRFAQYS